MDKTNSRVDAFIGKAARWREEMQALRAIALGGGLSEELKWGQPCYTFQKKNIVIIQPFKESCALMFFNGALLKDSKKILEKPGDNSHIARRVPFTSLSEITKLKSTLKAYIKEAVEAEKAGKKVAVKKQPEPVPEELKAKFKELPAFKKAFEALTPGRRRAYILHFSQAKQSSTRTSRIEKCMPGILAGKGLNE